MEGDVGLCGSEEMGWFFFLLGKGVSGMWVLLGDRSYPQRQVLDP